MHFADQLTEVALFVFEELLRLIELKDLTFTQDENLVGLNDGLKTMGNCDDSAMLELLRDQGLDLLLGYDIDVGSGFIKKDDLILTQNSTTDANQLLLTRTEVSTIFSDFEVKLILGLLIFLWSFSSLVPV